MSWLLQYRALVLTGDLLTWGLRQTEAALAQELTGQAAAWCYGRARQLCEG